MDFIAGCAILALGFKAIVGGGSSRKRGRKNSNYKDAMGWSHDNHQKLF